MFLLVHPVNFLVFNRVPKTGSTFIIQLLHKLKNSLNYHVYNHFLNEGRTWIDTKDGQLEEVNDMLSLNVPGVWTRHYAFLDFKQFGYNWRPNYINFVRNPIEKVNILLEFRICTHQNIYQQKTSKQFLNF